MLDYRRSDKSGGITDGSENLVRYDFDSFTLLYNFFTNQTLIRADFSDNSSRTDGKASMGLDVMQGQVDWQRCTATESVMLVICAP